MAYYQGVRGDYYRGGRGDPFSIGGMLSGVAKVAGGVVGGFLKGGPLGAIAGGIQAFPGGAAVTPGINPVLPPPLISSAGLLSSVPVPSGRPALPGYVQRPAKGIGAAISRILPGGETGYVYGRRPRMNVTNPRALRRAIRRVSGFGKLVQRSKRAIAKANTAVGNKHRAATKRRFGK